MQKYRGDSNKQKSSDDDHLHSKLGYLQSEKEVVHETRKMTGTEEARHPVTILVEAADDIVYSTVDLEDARRKGVITWEEVQKYLKDHICDQISESDTSEQEQQLRSVLNDFKTVIANAEKRVEKGDAGLQEDDEDEARMLLFRTYLIGKHVAAVTKEFAHRYDSIMKGKYTGELLYDSETGPIAKACKDVNYNHVITSNEIGKLEYMGRTVMHDLMDIFWEGAKNAPDVKDFQKKIYKLTSANYRSVFKRALEDGNRPPAYTRLQLVADYVCGMTDTYACQLHRELTNG